MKVIEAVERSVKVDSLKAWNSGRRCGLRLYVKDAYDIADFDFVAVVDELLF